ncbi:MAG TPA: peptidylprolyl isomerase [Chloroflexota bacterium]|nr:peptidylprolyl isomerase [Chloroflexota bacterium]
MYSLPRRNILRTFFAMPLALLAGCGDSGNAAQSQQNGQGNARPAPAPGAVNTNTGGAEPERVQVQHILIGFSGSMPGKRITRTQEEAKALAYDILKKAQSGENFDNLLKQHSDDSPPGIYGMVNRGVAPAGPGEHPRDRLVPAFGNVAFKLPVGGYGIADFDRQTSPFGYHIIKRIK